MSKVMRPGAGGMVTAWERVTPSGRASTERKGRNARLASGDQKEWDNDSTVSTATIGSADGRPIQPVDYRITSGVSGTDALVGCTQGSRRPTPDSRKNAPHGMGGLKEPDRHVTPLTDLPQLLRRPSSAGTYKDYGPPTLAPKGPEKDQESHP